MNSLVLSAQDGRISFMGWIGGYGYTIEIEHEDGFLTRYAHLRIFRKDIAVGKTVFLGQPIAYIGVSGHTTGPHLHFELRKNGQPINPLVWLGLGPCS